MNTISQQQLLSAVYSKVLDKEFHADSLDDRIILQKTVFFMRELGFSCGNYKFVWDLYGPFSPALSDDMKKKVRGDKEIVFNQDAEEIMQRLKTVFAQGVSYNLRYWIEAVASLHYLKKYVYPSYSDEEVIAALENRKKDYLCDHQENLRAMNALTEILEV